MVRLTAGVALASAATFGSASETMECAREAMALYEGNWTCNSHYFDYEKRAISMFQLDDRVETTASGARVFLVDEDGSETLVQRESYTERAIRYEQLSENGEITEVSYSVVLACDGPDADGFYKLHTTRTGPYGGDVALARGTTWVSPTGNFRSIVEWTADGDTWHWDTELICIRKAAAEE